MPFPIQLLQAFYICLCINGFYAANPSTNAVHIFPDSSLFATEGGSISFYCERHYKASNTEWTFPINSTVVKDNRAIKTDITMIQEGSIRKYLQIDNLKITDAGQYTCCLENNRSISDTVDLRVFAANEKPPEPSISFDETAIIFNGHNLSMTCYTDQMFILRWTGPGNSSAKSNNRFVESIAITDKQVQNTLYITNVSTLDNGEYTCVSTYRDNQQINTRTQLVDTIYATTGAYMKKNSFARSGEAVQLECKIVSNMSCDVTWYFKTCDWNMKSKFHGNSNCLDWLKIDAIPDEELDEGSQYSIIEYQPQSAGQVKCMAVNQNESHVAVANVYVQPLDSELTLVTHPSQIFNGNTTIVSCFASKYIFRDSVNLLRDGQLVAEDTDIQIQRIDAEFMYEIRIEFSKISLSHSGVYQCSAETYENEVRQVQTNIVVFAAPYVTTKSHETEDVAVSIVTTLILSCESVTGFPAPIIQWLKDSEPIPSTNRYVMINSTHLIIDRSIEDDSGTYECEAVNEFGRIVKTFNVKVTAPDVSYAVVVVIVICASISVVIAVAVLVLNRKMFF